MLNKERLIIIIGPSGSGKSTLGNNLSKCTGYEIIVPYTTREKRDGEEDGVTYNYISIDEFIKRKDEGEFVEYQYFNASFGKVYYGTLIKDYKLNGNPKILITNPFAAKAIIRFLPELNPIVIKLSTVSDDLLKERLSNRGDSYIEIERRLRNDHIDMEKFDKFINDNASYISCTIINMEIMGLPEEVLTKNVLEAIENELSK